MCSAKRQKNAPNEITEGSNLLIDQRGTTPDTETPLILYKRSTRLHGSGRSDICYVFLVFLRVDIHKSEELEVCFSKNVIARNYLNVGVSLRLGA